jgi:hypothetical protein
MILLVQIHSSIKGDTPMIDITYNRQAKEYEFVNPETGELHTAPAKAKADLFRAAVAMLDPELFAAAERVIARHPQLERVTWRAVELVANDAVEVYPAPRGAVVAMVEASDGLGRYAVETGEYGHTCQCEHFTSFAAPVTESGARFCKHILAFRLWLQVRAEW